MGGAWAFVFGVAVVLLFLRLTAFPCFVKPLLPAAAVLGNVAAVLACSDDNSEGGKRHASQQLLGCVFDEFTVDVSVGERGRCAHQGAKLVVVGGADVDVAKGAGGFEELIWHAQVRDWLPDEQRAGRMAGNTLAEVEDALYKINASSWRADEMEGFCSQERLAFGKGFLIEAELGGGIAKGAIFGGVISIPATSCETGLICAEETGGLPGLDSGFNGRGEIAPLSTIQPIFLDFEP